VVLIGWMLAVLVAGGLILLPAVVPAGALVEAGAFAVVELDAGVPAVLLVAGASPGSLRFSGVLVDCAQTELASRLRAEAKSNGLIHMCSVDLTTATRQPARRAHPHWKALRGRKFLPPLLSR
jgi:hypothetical protein